MQKRWNRLTLSILAVATVILAFGGKELFAEEAPGPVEADALARYVAQEDANYGFTRRWSGSLAGGDLVELILTSQTWRGTTWKHQLFIYRPAEVRHPDQALLLIGGGAWKEDLAKLPTGTPPRYPREAALVAAVANQVGAPVAVLLQVPCQPLLDGRYEDDAIAYTFEQFIRTGDDTWPLLLPMVKSAVRAMDAVQTFTRDEWSLDVKTFTVTGASKRGWTTWLTAAVDPRVRALAPMVIDMLNIPPQMAHQRDTWGTYSEQIEDYTRRGLQQHLASNAGGSLVSIVDPFSYRRRLQQPKLILLGTNDRYWPLDALNLYWDELPGEKYVLYVPNNGHGLKDVLRVGGTVAALVLHSTGEAPLPKLEWSFEEQGDTLVLHLESDTKPNLVQAWTASSESRDFRDAVWSAKPAPANDRGWVCELPRPGNGYSALFAEAVFPGQAIPFYLSTTLRIVGPTVPAE